MSGDVWLSPVESGGVGTWFGPGLPGLPVESATASDRTEMCRTEQGARIADLARLRIGLPAWLTLRRWVGYVLVAYHAGPELVVYLVGLILIQCSLGPGEFRWIARSAH